MTIRALLAVLVLVAVAGIAVPAAADYQDDAESDDVPVGAEISAVVQTTDAEAEGAVEDGVFEARFERADDAERAALLDRRSERLDARADRLETRVDEVERDRANDTVEQRARAAGVAAQLRALERSTNRTEQRARDAGVQARGLADVRDRTDALEARDGVQIAREVQGTTDPGAPDGVPGRGPAGPADDAAAERGDDAQSDDGGSTDDGGQPDREQRDDEQAAGSAGVPGDGTEGSGTGGGPGDGEPPAAEDRSTGTEAPEAPDAGPDAARDEPPSRGGP